VTNDQIIDEIIRREGGDQFTDRPSDRGGPTKYGITQKAWDDYLNAHGYARDATLPPFVRDIDRTAARHFYFAMHVTPFVWIVDDALRELVVDCSVNHGRTRATRWLQLAAGVEPDGVIGPKTRAAANTSSAHELYVDILRRRFRFYALIASDQLPADPDLPNLRGWIARACEFIR
jgi:lysozyme family protein